MARQRSKLLIGAPPPAAHDAAVRRALAPMIVQARATIGKVHNLSDVDALDRALKRAWPDSKIRQLLLDIGKRAEPTASRPWRVLQSRQDAKRKLPEYDADELLDKWSREAAARITSVRSEIAERLRQDIVEGAKQGLSVTEVIAGIQARGGVPVLWGTAEGRVKVIAQNQTAILHARVQRERARSVGVTQFVWRTQGDDAVRAEHRSLDGRSISYNSPGSEGLPGEPPGCRCWAESIVPIDAEAIFGGGLIEE